MTGDADRSPRVSRTMAATAMADRLPALIVGGGFLIVVVATGRLFGKLNTYDVAIAVLSAFLFLGWLAAPRSLRLSRFDFLLMGSLMTYASLMAVVAATGLTDEPQPQVQLMFLARVAGLFVVLTVFAFLAACWPATTLAAFGVTALLLLAYVARTFITGEFTGYYDYLDIPGTRAPLQSGFAFGILATLFLGLVVIDRSTIRRLFYLLLALSLGFSAVGTVSRTNTLAVAAVLVAVPFVAAVFRGKYRQMFLLALALAALAGGLLVAYVTDLLPDVVYGPLNTTLRRLGRIDAASSVRLRNWLSYFADAPAPVAIYWLTGLGVGAQSVLSEVKLGFTLRFDSLYLRIFFEWGVIGAALWITFFARLLYRVRRDSPRLAVPLVLVLAYGAVVGVTHEWLFVGVSGYLYMAICGALVGWAVFERRSAPDRPRRAKAG